MIIQKKKKINLSIEYKLVKRINHNFFKYLTSHSEENTVILLETEFHVERSHYKTKHFGKRRLSANFLTIIKPHI